MISVCTRLCIHVPRAELHLEMLKNYLDFFNGVMFQYIWVQAMMKSLSHIVAGVLLVCCYSKQTLSPGKSPLHFHNSFI